MERGGKVRKKPMGQMPGSEGVFEQTRQAGQRTKSGLYNRSIMVMETRLARPRAVVKEFEKEMAQESGGSQLRRGYAERTAESMANRRIRDGLQ